MKTIQEQLKKDREICEKAIKGPWSRNGYTNYSGYSVYAENAGCVAERWQDGLTDIEQQRLRDTGEFIAHARTRMPALIKALEILVSYHQELIDDGFGDGTILSKVEKVLGE